MKARKKENESEETRHKKHLAGVVRARTAELADAQQKITNLMCALRGTEDTVVRCAGERDEARHVVDELRAEIRRREADFSERIEALHADLRMRTEERDGYCKGMEDQRSEAIRARKELDRASAMLTDALQRVEDLRGQADQNSRVYAETLTEVGRWSMAARTLAAMVIARKTDGARDVAEFIYAIKD